jgi:hypothetical protein
MEVQSHGAYFYSDMVRIFGCHIMLNSSSGSAFGSRDSHLKQEAKEVEGPVLLLLITTLSGELLRSQTHVNPFQKYTPDCLKTS